MAGTLRLTMKVGNVQSSVDKTGATASQQVMLATVGAASELLATGAPVQAGGTLSVSLSDPAAFGVLLPEQFYFVDLTETTEPPVPPLRSLPTP